MDMGRVVVVGSFNVDHVWRCQTLPQPGETVSGTYATGPGGKGFNQAIAAQRAGAPTAFLCALGEDAGAQLAHSLAEADGLDLRVRGSHAPTGSAGIYVNAQGRNSIVIGPGANDDLDPEFIAGHATLLASASVVLAQLEVPASTVLAALRAARDAGTTTVLNPAPANVTCDAQLLALADVLTPNETEFATLARVHLSEPLQAEAVAGLPDAQLHALCRALLPAGSVVLTLGAAGSFVSHAARETHGDDAFWYRMPAEPANTVDTTGAGDAFNGALAASWATRVQVFAEHVRYAGRFAALSTESHGAAAAMPRRAEVEARFPR
jgi:ribokinase